MTRPDVELSTYRYPEDWPEVANDVRVRAGVRCECRGECANPYCTNVQSPEGRCKVQEQRHYPPHTVVALDHNPENAGHLGDRPNLRAFCPTCADAHHYGLQRPPGGNGDDSGRPGYPAQMGLDL